MKVPFPQLHSKMAINAFYITINKMNMKQFVRSGLEIGRTLSLCVKKRHLCTKVTWMVKGRVVGR